MGGEKVGLWWMGLGRVDRYLANHINSGKVVQNEMRELLSLLLFETLDEAGKISSST